MRHLLAAIIFPMLLPSYIHAQVGKLEQPEERIETPSLESDTSESPPFNLALRDEFGRLDSIETVTSNSFIHFRYSYDSVTTAAGVASMNIQRSIESLNNLNFPTDKLTQKLDSIARWKDEGISRIEARVLKLKADVWKKLQSLDLPDDLKKQAASFTSAMEKLDISTPDLGLAGLTGDANLSTALPDLTTPLEGQTLPNIDLPETGLGEVSQYTGQLSHLPTNLDEASSLAESQVKNLSQVSDVTEQLGDVTKLAEATGSLPDQEALKKELLEEAQKQAIDHLQGKEQQLQSAMETLSRYKKKYGSLQGLDQIPKRKPNEMRDKPFIERLVPGIAFQIHRKDAWMVDFSPYAGYRFNSRLTAGAGWNQRVAYDAGLNEFDADLRIYGPRLYGEHSIGQGFSGRLETEYMNTWVPPQFSSGHVDAQGREWVFSTMMGMKKEYKFVKNIKGTMMLLYNLYDPHHRSPYADRLVVRFGFEFPAKKRRSSRAE